MKNSDLVRNFHAMLRLPIRTKPRIPSTEEGLLRLDLIEEETNELAAALRLGDIVGVADALGDLLYVCYGACLVFGIDADAVFQEIHAANMRKLGPDGKPILREDGKVLKPEGWQPPDIAKVLGVFDWSAGA
jgi:predicted HAD superfamily Cof-like phosphohydrolase